MAELGRMGKSGVWQLKLFKQLGGVAMLIADLSQGNSTTRQYKPILDSPLYIAATFEPKIVGCPFNTYNAVQKSGPHLKMFGRDEGLSKNIFTKDDTVS